MNLPVRGGTERFEIDPGQSVREGAVVIRRQGVDEEIGVAIDQCRRRLELPGLALDQGAAGVVELGLAGGPAPRPEPGARGGCRSRRRPACPTGRRS